MIFQAATQPFWAYIRQPASPRCESAHLSGHDFLYGIPAEHGKSSNLEGTTHFLIQLLKLETGSNYLQLSHQNKLDLQSINNFLRMAKGKGLNDDPTRGFTPVAHADIYVAGIQKLQLEGLVDQLEWILKLQEQLSKQVMVMETGFSSNDGHTDDSDNLLTDISTASDDND
ncbi:hypothetical protein MJO28_002978 [Puccinia striiformis f. sp. tritici]|uniref:Uncharacterized protein n=1 Tax=Puccinia striiformis f. sp. tritici TaxID=168172 RepID=A0ACC0ERD0_9BASI|nr:hypothetical protein MJO28_002978 [Puccinia striiformis f. sp. tritici]